MRIFLLLLGLCSGCYHEPDDNNDLSASIPNRAPDIISDSGVFVYVETDSPAIFKPEKLDTWRRNVEFYWNYTQDCLGMYSDDPPVVLIIEEITDCGPHKNSDPEGCTKHDENLILIEDKASASASLWRHEFIHVILRQNGIDDELNSNHKPEYLWDCENI